MAEGNVSTVPVGLFGGYMWIDHESVAGGWEHLPALDLYRDRVVQPALDTLEAALAELEHDDDAGSVFYHNALATIYDATVQGFVLVVQSMFERGLRALLSGRTRTVGIDPAPDVARALWSGGKTRSPSLQTLFVERMGIPLTDFDSFHDLDLLQVLGSALRHGDGPASRMVFERAPSLWFHWLPPRALLFAQGAGREVRVPLTAPTHPNMRHLILPRAFLEQMIRSVGWFWADIEALRVQSFRRRAPDTDRFLGEMAEAMAVRPELRTWPDPLM